MTTTTRRDHRGSTLVIAMILLAVLSVIGVSAVLLSSQERANAAAKGRLDALGTCARAAQAQIWAEIAKYGPSYFGSTNLVPGPIQLPGGVTLQAPSHYGQATSGVAVNSVVLALDKAVSDGTLAEDADLTNRSTALDRLGSGRAYRAVARCTDAKGRQMEVEFTTRFALF